MANSYSDTLFELIKSLSKSEKRYFKLYSSRHTIGQQNNSVLLFDFICKMKVYEEEEIFEHFKGASFLNKFSITKNRLYQQILGSLDSYHSQDSIENELNRALHSAEILFNKGLYHQSKKILDSTKRKAKKHNQKHILLQIIEKQKKYIEKDIYTNLKPEELNQLLEEEQSNIKQISIQAELWHIKSKLFKTINSLGTIRSEEDLEVLNNVVVPMAKYIPEELDVENQYLYHHIKSGYYFTVNDLTACYSHLKANILMFKAHSHMVKASPNNYFSVITNFIYTCTKLKYYEEANEYLNDFINNTDFLDNKDLEIKYFSSRYSLELFLLLEKGELQKAEELIPEIEEALERYKNKISSVRQAYLDFQIGVVLLSGEKYHEALKWVNKIVNDPNLSAKQDIYCFAQLIQLIIHFELKNYRYLPYVLTSTKRFLKDRNRLNKFEEVFLKLIQKIKFDHLNTFDIEDIFRSMEKDIDALKEDEFEKVAFEYFDFSAWLKSKIHRKSYLEIKMAG